MSKKITVTGAGGFIGGWLVKDLLNQGHQVKAVDIKPVEEWSQVHMEAENLSLDLRCYENCLISHKGSEEIYALACNMGGIGFIERFKAECAFSVVMSANSLKAAVESEVSKYFYSSSACVYSAEKQRDPNLLALKEEDIYPISAEPGYGEEKLFTESLCKYFREDYGIGTRVARYHNVYGSSTLFEGGKEKAPAAICRKVIEAKLSGKHEIEIWGDGNQTRSFMYVDDCVKGSQLIMNSEIYSPINLGSSEMVTINQLVDIVEQIACIKLKRVYNLEAPKGVNGRNSDNTLIKSLFNWEPSTPLREGLEKTYAWIYNQIKNNG